MLNNYLGTCICISVYSVLIEMLKNCLPIVYFPIHNFSKSWIHLCTPWKQPLIKYLTE